MKTFKVTRIIIKKEYHEVIVVAENEAYAADEAFDVELSASTLVDEDSEELEPEVETYNEED